jgi:hypothetical protein
MTVVLLGVPVTKEAVVNWSQLESSAQYACHHREQRRPGRGAKH